MKTKIIATDNNELKLEFIPDKQVDKIVKFWYKSNYTYLPDNEMNYNKLKGNFFKYQDNNLYHLLLIRSKELYLPSNIDILDRLMQISIFKTKISSFPKSIINNNLLTHIYMFKCRILGNENIFSNIRQVKHIKLDRCLLVKSRLSLNALVNLEVLEILGCNNLIIDYLWGKLNSIKVLKLYNNDLRDSDFEQIISIFPNLEYLDLSFNKISSIPSNIKNLDSLRLLNLRNNLIPPKFELSSHPIKQLIGKGLKVMF